MQDSYGQDFILFFLHLLLLWFFAHLASKETTINDLRSRKKRAEDEKEAAYNELSKTLDEQRRDHEAEKKQLKAELRIFKNWPSPSGGREQMYKAKTELQNKVKVLEQERNLFVDRGEALLAEKEALETRLHSLVRFEEREPAIIAEKTALEAKIKTFEKAQNPTPQISGRATMFSDDPRENEIASLKQQREKITQKYYDDLRGRDDKIEELENRIFTMKRQPQIRQSTSITSTNYEEIITRLKEQLDLQFMTSSAKEDMLRSEHEKALAPLKAFIRAQQAEGQKLVHENSDLKTENHLLKALVDDGEQGKAESQERFEKELKDLKAKLLDATGDTGTTRYKLDDYRQRAEQHGQQNTANFNGATAHWRQKADDAEKLIKAYEEGEIRGNAELARLSKKVGDAEMMISGYQEGERRGNGMVASLQQRLEKMQHKVASMVPADEHQKLIKELAEVQIINRNLNKQNTEGKGGSAISDLKQDYASRLEKMDDERRKERMRKDDAQKEALNLREEKKQLLLKLKEYEEGRAFPKKVAGKKVTASGFEEKNASLWNMVASRERNLNKMGVAIRQFEDSMETKDREIQGKQDTIDAVKMLKDALQCQNTELHEQKQDAMDTMMTLKDALQNQNKLSIGKHQDATDASEILKGALKTENKASTEHQQRGDMKKYMKSAMKGTRRGREEDGDVEDGRRVKFNLHDEVFTINSIDQQQKDQPPADGTTHEDKGLDWDAELDLDLDIIDSSDDSLFGGDVPSPEQTNGGFV